MRVTLNFTITGRFFKKKNWVLSSKLAWQEHSIHRCLLILHGDLLFRICVINTRKNSILGEVIVLRFDLSVFFR